MKYIPPSVKKGVLNYSKPLKISKDNTLILYRLLPKGRIHWKDMIKRLEVRGFYLLNSIECYDICGSKYITDVYLKTEQHQDSKHSSCITFRRSESVF